MPRAPAVASTLATQDEAEELAQQQAAAAATTTTTTTTTHDSDNDDDDDETEDEDEATAKAASAKKKASELAKAARKKPAKRRVVDADDPEQAPTGVVRRTMADHHAEREGSGGAVPTAGRVKWVQAVDFMCHRNLKVEFPSLITFVGGPNGSGKSAIVAALQIGLGLGASETHRGTQLSDLVRNGATGPALVRVALTNEGDTAYKPEEFGDTIVVERIIPNNRPGAAASTSAATSRTTFSLISGRTGRPVETGKDKVEALVDRFQMYVDNPTVVLDQESAKLFLKGNDQAKYQFFLDATDLEKMMEHFDNERQIRKDSKRKLKVADENVKLYQRTVDKAKRLYESLNEVRTLADRVEMLGKEYVWLRVRDAERDASAAQVALDKVRAKHDEFSKKRDELEAEKAKMSDTKAELQKRVEDAKTRVEEANALVMAKTAELKGAKKPIETNRKQAESLRKEADKLEARAKEADAKAAELRRKIMAGTQDDRLRRAMEELERVKAEMDEVTAAPGVEQLYQEKVAASDRVDASSRRAVECEMEVQSVRRKVEDTEERLRMMQALLASGVGAGAGAGAGARTGAASANEFARLNVLGDWLPDVAAQLRDHAAMFSAPPVVIGAHVRVAPQHARSEYLDVAWETLGSAMRRIVVNDQSDVSKVLQVTRGMRIPDKLIRIVTRKFGPRHVPQKPQGFTTMCDLVEVTDDNAFNALLDVTKFEQLALVSGLDEVKRRVWLGRDGNLQRIPNFLSAYEPDGTSSSVRGGSSTRETANQRPAPNRFA